MIPPSDRILQATFEDSGFREYHRRMQIFILLYIEAGSYINEEEDGWEFVVLLVTHSFFLNVRDVRDHTCRFEKRKRRGGTATYHFVGYSSLYNFYCFPEKVRLRLRWVKIFLSHSPTHPRKANLLSFRRTRGKVMDVSGCPIRTSHTPTFSVAELYTAIYNFVVSHPDVSELTVEDPAEAFEDLRDRNDLRTLLSNEHFMNEGFEAQSVTASHGGGRVQKVRSRFRSVPQSSSGGTKGRGKMGPPVDRAWSEKWRKDLKFAGVSTLLALSRISDRHCM